MEAPSPERSEDREQRTPLGDTIRGALAVRGWDQKTLARVLGRPASAVSEIVTGTRALTPEFALHLGAALDLPPVLLLHLAAYTAIERARTDAGAILGEILARRDAELAKPSPRRRGTDV